MPIKQTDKVADLTVDRWLTTTPAAWLFIINGKRVWVPKSIGEFSEDDSEVTVPEWWAIQQELV